MIYQNPLQASYRPRLRRLKNYFFKNGPIKPSFAFIFGLFKQTIQFSRQIKVKICPSSILRRDFEPTTSQA